jgi:hypothetical protein
MKIYKMMLISLTMFAIGVMLTGCKGARFITAKVKSVEASTLTNMDQVKYLMTTDVFPAPDQVKADQFRENTQTFYANKEKDFEVYGDTTGDLTVHMFAVSAPQATSTYPLPVEISLFTSSAHKVGQKTTHGYAEIRFGTDGPVYTTNLSDTFFQFELSAVYNENGDKIASGKFNCIARNKDDPTDTKRLIIMDGAYIARIK